MSNAMHVAKTGLNAQNRRMQVISNNLANVNTTGFKRDRANFETLLYQVLKTSGAQTTGETRTVSGFNNRSDPPSSLGPRAITATIARFPSSSTANVRCEGVAVT